MLIENLLRDLRFSWRSLWRQRAFTVIALLTLALGIGANSAIFSVLDAVVLSPLPYRDADALTYLWATREETGSARGQIMPAEFFAWQERAQSFDELAAFMFWGFNLTEPDREPETLPAAPVTPNLFPLLGVQAQLGRTFHEEEAILGRGHVVLLSHALWQRRFGGDPEVLGKVLTLDDQSHTVIGVLPPGFDFPHPDVELYAPMSFNPQGPSFRRPTVFAVGRLAPGVALSTAQQEMHLIARDLQSEWPSLQAGRGVELVALLEQTLGDFQPILLSLIGAVAVILLIACVNVANLLLARGWMRQGELATRKALGASRAGLIRQQLVESLLLAFSGGILGLPLALFGLEFLIALSPAEVPRLETAGLDGQVLLITALVSLMAGLLFGLLPAWHAARSEPGQLLQEGRTQTGEGRRGRWLSAGLIVGEVALALILLSAAGLLLRSLSKLENVPAGFQSDNLLALQLILPAAKYPGYQQITFYESLLERLRGLPGVSSVSATSALPLSPTRVELSAPFEIEGRPVAEQAVAPEAGLRLVTPGYFSTLGIPLLDGRDFAPTDRQGNTRVALVNQTLAERFWPNPPIGERLRIVFQGKRTYEIVGVVGAVRDHGPANEPVPEIYLPFLQSPIQAMTLVARTEIDPLTLLDATKKEVWAIDAAQPIASANTMDSLIATSLQTQRFHLLLLGLFALTALTLAAVGLYGVVSQSVNRRTREIGLRMALGADRQLLIQQVIHRALLLTSGGLLVGLVATSFLGWIFHPWMVQFLYQVSPTDPLALGLAAILLMIFAFFGSFLPARRVTRVDPMVILRHE